MCATSKDVVESGRGVVRPAVCRSRRIQAIHAAIATKHVQLAGAVLAERKHAANRTDGPLTVLLGNAVLQHEAAKPPRAIVRVEVGALQSGEPRSVNSEIRTTMASLRLRRRPNVLEAGDRQAQRSIHDCAELCAGGGETRRGRARPTERVALLGRLPIISSCCAARGQAER
jgi:hypothetical protein